MITEIEELLEAKDYHGLRSTMTDKPPQDIALLFEELPADVLPLLFRILPKEYAAECFVELDAEVQVCSGDGGELLDLMLETE